MKTITIEPIGKLTLIKDQNNQKFIRRKINGVFHLLPFESEETHEILALQHGKPPLTKAKVDSIINELKSEFYSINERNEVNKRYAASGSYLYINIGVENKLLQVSKKGIKHVKRKNIIFSSSHYTMPLMYKQDADANLRRIKKHLPFKEIEKIILILAWMVHSCLSNSDIPILLITGDSGSGKSTLASLIKKIIDPTSFGLEMPPTSIDQIRHSAKYNHVLSFNNVSKFNTSLQDMFCILSTGGNHAIRRMYKHDVMEIIELTRAVIINGLNSPFTQDDAINRCLHIHLDPLTDKDYAKTGGKEKRKAKLKSDLPQIFMGFVDLLQKVISIKDNIIIPSELPRMCDYAVTGIIVENALDLPEGTFLQAYKANINIGLLQIIEDSEAAQALLS